MQNKLTFTEYADDKQFLKIILLMLFQKIKLKRCLGMAGLLM